MFQEFIGNAEQYMMTNPWLALAAVFFGGLLTASNPCVLAMIPLIISFVASRKDERLGVLRAFLYSLVFVSGLAITFTALGVIAALAGKLYGDVSGLWNWIVAAVCLVMGLHLTGLLDFTIPAPLKAQPATSGAFGAFIMGLLFGAVSLPCAAPILIVLLVYLTGSGSSVPFGALLLFVYAMGHSVLILIAGTSMGAARRLIESRNITRATDIMRRASGVLILFVGAYFVFIATR
ncbi:cytochrome c biogenesis CcdA family protein [Thermodesulfobacteriota bacterium]